MCIQCSYQLCCRLTEMWYWGKIKFIDLLIMYIATFQSQGSSSLIRQFSFLLGSCAAPAHEKIEHFMKRRQRRQFTVVFSTQTHWIAVKKQPQNYFASSFFIIFRHSHIKTLSKWQQAVTTSCFHCLCSC